MVPDVFDRQRRDHRGIASGPITVRRSFLSLDFNRRNMSRVSIYMSCRSPAFGRLDQWRRRQSLFPVYCG